jgi:hypothetical protein
MWIDLLLFFAGGCHPTRLGAGHGRVTEHGFVMVSAAPCAHDVTGVLTTSGMAGHTDGMRIFVVVLSREGDWCMRHLRVREAARHAFLAGAATRARSRVQTECQAANGPPRAIDRRNARSACPRSGRRSGFRSRRHGRRDTTASWSREARLGARAPAARARRMGARQRAGEPSVVLCPDPGVPAQRPSHAGVRDGVRDGGKRAHDQTPMEFVFARHLLYQQGRECELGRGGVNARGVCRTSDPSTPPLAVSSSESRGFR